MTAPARGLRPDHPARRAYRDRAVSDAYARERFASGSGPATDRREREVLTALLDRTGLPAGARVLDCPAGAGRLSSLLAARGWTVAAADQSAAMLAHAGAALAAAGAPRTLVAADALALPFRPGAFDLVLCHRLLHHLEREEDRRALLASLAAASRRWVVVSWFDSVSLQHLRRAARRAFRQSLRHAVSRAAFRRAAAAAGLRPVEDRAVRRFVSEATLSLLEVAR